MLRVHQSFFFYITGCVSYKKMLVMFIPELVLLIHIVDVTGLNLHQDTICPA